MNLILSKAHSAENSSTFDFYREPVKAPRQVWKFGSAGMNEGEKDGQAHKKELSEMSRQELFDMFSKMGQEKGDEETVLTSRVAAEAILDEAW